MMRQRLDLRNVTAICIDGRQLSQEALDHYERVIGYMTANIQFAKVKLLMVNDPAIAGTEFVKIEPIDDLQKYSQFCLNRLHEHVDTEFCMIFQDDGFPINPEMWRPVFLDYDYIGAPWPPLHPWPEPERPDRRVGNGGFCIRSKRLLEKVKDFQADQNEDIVIVCERRAELDAAGFKFAPVNIAIDFSIETQFLYEQTMQRCFGFHGKYRVEEALKIISAKSNQVYTQ